MTELGAPAVTPRLRKLSVTLWIDPNATTFKGEGVYDLQWGDRSAAIEALRLRATGLRIQHARLLLGGRHHPLVISAEGDERVLSAAEPIAPEPGPMRLQLRWTGMLQARPDGIFQGQVDGRAHVIFRSSRHGPLPFPCAVDAHQATSLTLSLHVPMGSVAVANARLLDRRGTDASICWRFATTSPLSSAALGFAVGPFSVEDGPSDPLPLRAYGMQVPWSTIQRELAVLSSRCRRPWPDPILNVIAVPDLPTPTHTAAGMIFVQPQARLTRADWRLALARGWFGRLVVFADPAHAESCARALAHPADTAEHSDWFASLDPLEGALAALSEADRSTAFATCVRRGAHGVCTPADLIRGIPTADGRAAVQTAFEEPSGARMDIDHVAPETLVICQTPCQPDSTRQLRLVLGRGAADTPFACFARGPRTAVQLPFAPDWIRAAAHSGWTVRLPESALQAPPHSTLPRMLWAHFEGGVIEADQLFDRLVACLRADDLRTVHPAALYLKRMADQLVPHSHRAAFMASLADTLDAVLARPLDASLRAAVLLLRVHAPDPSFAQALRAQTEERLNDAPIADLPAVVASTGDPSLFDAILDVLTRTPIGPRHAVLVRALGHFTDPVLMEKAVMRFHTPALRASDLMRLLEPITRHRPGRDVVRRLIESQLTAWARKVDHETWIRVPFLAVGTRTASERSAWATVFATGPLRARDFAPAVRRVLPIIDRHIQLGARASSPLRARLSDIQLS